MAYLALYREWRPKLFQDIVGQEHITKTLTNALKQKKIAHAYLFSGPRGTGKTTAAKILAKALNCEHPQGVEPCNQCPSCLSIDQGAAMEVFEIDAASNRGIDEIRDLRENVKLSARQGKYKAYIIDEVHMLTTEAFNALLKTLEEPPPQVIFILATTEAPKVPVTILSRVQRFEFHRLSVQDMRDRLAEVSKSLNRQIAEDALTVIAQKAEGSLRDALSILDQCLLQDDPVGVAEVYAVLGMVGETFSAQLTEALLAADYGECLSFLSEGIQQGRDPRQIIKELLEYLRQALLTAATGESPMVAPHLQEQLGRQSGQIGISRLLKWISILLQGESQLKYAANARLAAELLLVQTIYESQESALSGQDEISKRLTALEQQVQGLSLDRVDLQREETSERKSAGMKSSVSKTKRLSPEGVSSSPAGQNRKPVVAAEGAVDTQGESEQNVALGEVQERWPEVLEQVKKLKKSTQAFLLEGKPVLLQENNLTILFREGCSFHRDKVNQAENRRTIEEVLKRVFGGSLTIQNVMEGEFTGEESAAGQEGKSREQALIDKAKDIFGPDLVVVKEE